MKMPCTNHNTRMIKGCLRRDLVSPKGAGVIEWGRSGNSGGPVEIEPEPGTFAKPAMRSPCCLLLATTACSSLFLERSVHHPRHPELEGGLRCLICFWLLTSPAHAVSKIHQFPGWLHLQTRRRDPALPRLCPWRGRERGREEGRGGANEH